MYLGLDLGTSAVKAICIDGATILATASAPLDISSPQSGWSEQAPTDWWDATCAAIRMLGESISLADIRAVGLSGQMHGAVLLDADQNVIRPAILWNDSRSVAECAVLQDALPDVGTLAGIPPLPGFTAPKVMWLARHEPEAYSAIANILLPKDYIGFRLHGQMVTDPSDAAGTMWLNQSTRDWEPRILAATGTALEWLPALHDGHDIVGTVTRDAAETTGLPSGIPVVAGGGDAATGAVSLGATEPGRGFVSLGTSGQLFVADRVYRPNPDQYVHAYAHTVPDRWFQMAAMLNGARPISWIGEQLDLTPGDVVSLAETARADRIPVFLPYLTGERSPHGDPHIRAGFFGLEDTTARSELCRAVVEAVAFCFADAAESFGPSMETLPKLFAIGGGSRSDFLLSLLATATGKPITRLQGADSGPAFGAAQLAACGTGALAMQDFGVSDTSGETFDPNPDTGFADRLDRFRATYAALKSV
ncbi:xylulokinase [Shimia ponticola]|uniref:xylulokinase n=1 Tax=Shimia ponticola TaxID=2582893 RepID=UPI0011BED98D|nr:xylulokinase [Shimia ponticola]